jgi:hypothetical protein
MPVSAGCNPAAKGRADLSRRPKPEIGGTNAVVSGQKADKAVGIATLRSFQAGFPNTVS